MKYIKEVFNKNEERIESFPKLDLSLFKKRSSAKTYPGYLIGKMKQARDDGNLEVVALIHHFYKKYSEMNTERFTQKQWKGKSGIRFIEKPDRVICISYQKFELGEPPKEIKTEITKQQINKVLNGINLLKDKDEFIHTKDIAEIVYKRDWKKVFSDRTQHITLTKILNYLEYKKFIDYYRSGKIKLKLTQLKGGKK